MKKRNLVIFLALFVLTVALSAQSLGTGVTVFVPDSMWLSESGTVSVETGLDTSLGLGNLLSIPFGVTYIKTDGFHPDGIGSKYVDYSTANSPWYIADVLLAHIMLEARVDVGPVYLSAHGGVAGSWLMSHSPLKANIESFYTGIDSSNPADIHLSNFTDTFKFGVGWLAGGSFGVVIGDIEAGINATYRNISHNGTVQAGRYLIAQDGSAAADSEALNETINLFLRGLSVGISGSFSF